jgi:hypothetical protein
VAEHEEEFSDEVLEETPTRVTQFLGAIVAVSGIRTTMEVKAFMASEDLAEGQRLLMAVLTAPEPAAPVTDTPEARAGREAAADIDSRDESMYAMAGGALRRANREAGRYVFKDLQASRGISSVRGMAVFLGRLKALDEGTDPTRAATRESDRAAIALLAERGITAERRAELQAKVDLVLGPTPPLPDPAVVVDPADRWRKLVALKLWYDDWAAVAHAVIHKRAHLILLGLAERKRKKAEGHRHPGRSHRLPRGHANRPGSAWRTADPTGAAARIHPQPGSHRLAPPPLRIPSLAPLTCRIH